MFVLLLQRMNVWQSENISALIFGSLFIFSNRSGDGSVCPSVWQIKCRQVCVIQLSYKEDKITVWWGKCDILLFVKNLCNYIVWRFINWKVFISASYSRPLKVHVWQYIFMVSFIGTGGILYIVFLTWATSVNICLRPF